MERGDDMRSLDEIFRDAQPSISFAPVNETPKPSGQVLGRDFYHDSAGRTIVGDTVTDQMGGGANPVIPFECPSITLYCDSITATKSKCGFTPFLGQEEQQPGSGGHYYLEQNVDCFVTGLAFWTTEVSFPSWWLTVNGSSTGCDACTAEETYEINYDSATCVPSPDPSGVNRCDHEILSNEYTTALLISNTEGALPSYDDDFNDSCSASRDLSEFEDTYTIQRFKPKFTFAAQAQDFTITYNEHFVPDVGSPVDVPRSVFVATGETEVIGPEVMEPSEDGTITITDVTCA